MEMKNEHRSLLIDLYVDDIHAAPSTWYDACIGGGGYNRFLEYAGAAGLLHSDGKLTDAAARVIAVIGAALDENDDVAYEHLLAAGVDITA